MKPRLLSGAIQVRIFAPKESNPQEYVQNWSVPGWVIPIASPSVGWGLKQGTGGHPTVLHKRIADKMGIVDGDEIEVEFVEYGMHCVLPVQVQDGLSAPFLINGFLQTGCLERYVMDDTGEKMICKDGNILRTSMQSFWYGMRVDSQTNHVVILTFDGCCKNNPAGPSGYGFAIHRGDDDTDDCSMGDLLVQGYGYSPSGGSSNRMEYAGLMEGLYWAKLVHTKKIIVRGDSELVIKQLKGEYRVDHPTLKIYHFNVLQLVEHANRGKIEVQFQHIRREKNQIADALANMGTALKENAVAVIWENCNKLYLGM